MASSTQSAELEGYGPAEPIEGAHALAGYGPPEPIQGAHVDMGPDARRALVGGPKMPEPKTDEELGIGTGPIGDYDKRDARRFLQGRNDEITTPEAREKRDTRAHREDPIANDPLAGMIAQGIPAAGAGIVAGGLTRLAAPGLAPLVQGATTGAASSPDAPVTGALLGAIPGVPAAARAADNAIGEAALSSVRPTGSPPSLPARIIGKGLGMAAGGATHGPLGMLVGHDLGGRAAGAFSRAADSATNALAERYLMQQADAGLAGRGLVQIGAQPGPQVSGASPVPMVNLAPLVHQPLPPPASVPGGAMGTPFLDEISGQPVTQAGRGGFLSTDAPTAAGKPLAPGLRDDVVRSAKTFREQSYDVDAPAGPSVEDQLARSVRMLGQLKSAKAAGKLTPVDIQDAVKAGMSPLAVAKVVGQGAFDSAMGR